MAFAASLAKIRLAKAKMPVINRIQDVHNVAMQRPTPFIAPEVFDNADAALQRVQAIYDQSLNHLREAMRRYVAGEPMVDKVRACYPFVR
ncbi:MAG: hypothetical protein RIT20_345, partial [Pseudomonadota bacterium]